MATKRIKNPARVPDFEPVPKLGPTEHLLTAFAAPASGPGWSNAPVVLIIQDGSGGPLRIAYLQPEHFDASITAGYEINALTNRIFTEACRARLKGSP